MNILINNGRIAPFFSVREDLLTQLKADGHSIILSGYEKGFNEKCEQLGYKLEYIEFNRAGINFIKDIKLFLDYRKIMKLTRPDIVHSYTIKPNIYGTIAARSLGIREIYPTINGLGYAFTNNTRKSRILRFIICLLYKISFFCAKKIIFQNEDDMKELVCRHVVRQDKCVVVDGSGVNLSKYPYSDKFTENSFLMASRLLITKGVRDYIKAAEIVKRKYGYVHFYLAGSLDPNPDGIKKEELDKYIEEGIIDYLGKVDNMVEVLTNCSVFVLPSYYREGIPHVLLEAMSIGRTLITTDSPGCKETVNGKNGFLVRKQDPEDLARKMIWAIENRYMLNEMGKESNLYAKRRFDVKIINKKILECMGL